MAAKHMKLLLAALALLLATATTFAHAACSTILNCESCSTPTECDNCTVGYTPVDIERSGCTSICREPNCQTCNTSETFSCVTCLPGYKMNKDGYCVPPCGVENCKTCATDSTCGTCADGFFIEEGPESCEDVEDYCFVPNCEECLHEFPLICKKCSGGYQLAENNTLCSGAVTPAGAATAAVAALALAVAALAL